jgi:hypothetical protein
LKNLNELVLRIAPDKFHFLKFILEGYDNMAILSSLNSREGLVVVRYPETSAKELFGVLEDICQELS